MSEHGAFAEFDEGINFHGSNFQPGLEDDTYLIMLNVLNRDDPRAIRDVTGHLEESIRRQYPENVITEKAGSLVEFLNGNKPPAEPQADEDLIDRILDLPEDTFFEALEEICTSDFGEEHEWVQRLVSAILFREPSDAKQHRNSMVIANAKHVFGAIKPYIRRRVGL